MDRANGHNVGTPDVGEVVSVWEGVKGKRYCGAAEVTAVGKDGVVVIADPFKGTLISVIPKDRSEGYQSLREAAYCYTRRTPGPECRGHECVLVVTADDLDAIATKGRKPTQDELANRFNHHAPKGDQSARYALVRKSIRLTAGHCVKLSPASPEQERALDHLDQAMFLFNAAIARHE